MDEMNAHLIANLSLTFLSWVLILFVVCAFLHVSVILKVVLSAVGILVAGYIGHRLIPRITGPMIDKLYEK